MKTAKLLKMALATLAIVFLVSSANAPSLGVDVSASPQVVVPSQAVKITASANMNGRGIVFVVQPVRGYSIASSESSDVQADLNSVSTDPDASVWRVISYVRVNIPSFGGGEQEFTFPDDFIGMNGEPSTRLMGRYFVFFVFMSRLICKIGFDCTSFFVVPEYPLGTFMAAVASFGALLGYVSVKRYRKKPS